MNELEILNNNLKKINATKKLTVDEIAWNIRIVSEYSKIKDSLYSEGIKCKPIKGIFIQREFGFTRLIKDIDIVVDYKNKKNVVELTQRMGFINRTKLLDQLRFKTTLKNIKSKIELDIHWATNIRYKQRLEYLECESVEQEKLFNADFLIENMYRDLNFDAKRLNDLKLCTKNIKCSCDKYKFSSNVKFINKLLENGLDLKKTSLINYYASISSGAIRKLIRVIAQS